MDGHIVITEANKITLCATCASENSTVVMTVGPLLFQDKITSMYVLIITYSFSVVQEFLNVA